MNALKALTEFFFVLIFTIMLRITGKLNISFEYWMPIKDTKVLQGKWNDLKKRKFLL